MKRLIFLFVMIVLFMVTGCAKAGDTTVRQAMQAYGSGELDTALSLFNQALNEDTNYSKELLLTFIANVYANQGEYEKAIASQKESLEKHADYRGYVTLGMFYHVIKDDENAVLAYQKAIDMNPKKGEAYASLGALYVSQHDAANALPLLEKASEYEPNIAIIQANLAVAYAMYGDREKSAAALEKARALKCEDIDQFEERIAEIFSAGTN